MDTDWAVFKFYRSKTVLQFMQSKSFLHCPLDDVRLLVNSFTTFQKEVPNYTVHAQTYGILSMAVIILTSLKWCHRKILESGLTGKHRVYSSGMHAIV